VVIRCGGCGARLFVCDLGDSAPISSAERDLLGTAAPAAQVLYDFIRRFLKQNGYAPTLREMRDGLGWGSPNSVTYYLRQLAAAGLIERDYGAARGIRLVHTS
jgi:SOS-response transcriptional repressor LexA